MKIDQLFQFVSVVENGSINKAAYELFISQSSLSRSIKLLEEEVGDTLLMRTSQGIALTSLGGEFYEYASTVCSNYRQLEQLRLSNKNLVNHRMRVSSHPLSFVEYAFTETFKKYQDQSPLFSLVQQPVSQATYDVKNGLSDVGVYMCTSAAIDNTHRLIRSLNLKPTVIARLPMVVLVSDRHPLALAGKKAISIKSLNQYTFTTGEGNIPWSELLSILRATGSDQAQSYINMSDKTGLINFVACTQTYSLIPSVEQCKVDLHRLNSAPVVTIPLIEEEYYFEVGWFKRANQELSSCCFDFVCTLQNLF